MDQYEDLQKFSEKTHMKSIKFIDFTKQNKEVNHGRSPIMQQLDNDSPPLGSPLSTGLVLPINNEPMPTKPSDPAYSTQLATENKSALRSTSLFKDVGAQMNRPVEPQHEDPIKQQPVAQTEPAVQPQPVVQLQSQPTIQAQVLFQPRPVIQAQEPSQTNFSHLFTASVDKPSVDEKDTPLQSLLKRIATCR